MVQKFYIGSTYGYALQLNNPSGSNDPTPNVVLSRGLLPTDGTKEIRLTDYMYLNNFGHGQTLEFFNWNGQDYFWIATNAADQVNANEYWSTQIGRVTFQSNTTIDYKDIKRLSSISSANKNGTPAFKLARADAALSSTPTANRTDNGKQRILLMSSDSTNADGTYQLTAYNSDTINTKLDQSSTNYLGCDKLTSSVVSTYKIKNKQDKFVIPNGSWQGLEFADNNMVYISGGQKGDTPKVIRGNWRFTQAKTVSLSGFSDTANVETEGIQLKGSQVLIGLEFHGGSDTPHTVYSFDKSAFD
ncbi:hypothetical protein FD08_GL001740 [Lentilactobacillus parakefiri DSM 10551]|nr:hypothetical protein FD08_GL001740 [Lentilactobacillus parakefiri DSM 10551]